MLWVHFIYRNSSIQALSGIYLYGQTITKVKISEILLAHTYEITTMITYFIRSRDTIHKYFLVLHCLICGKWQIY